MAKVEIKSFAAYLDETRLGRLNAQATLPPKISPLLPGSLLEFFRPGDDRVDDEVRPLLYHRVAQVFEFYQRDPFWMILS
jgi:hypothetical protein